MTTATITHTDEQIQREVLAELEWDAAVRSTEIGVAVKDGVVILTGWVDSYAKKVAAERAAHRVRGVRAVVNNIEVHLPSSAERTDVDIAGSCPPAGRHTGSDQQRQGTASRGSVTGTTDSADSRRLGPQRGDRRRADQSRGTGRQGHTPGNGALLGGEGRSGAGRLVRSRCDRSREPHHGHSLIDIYSSTGQACGPSLSLGGEVLLR